MQKAFGPYGLKAFFAFIAICKKKVFDMYGNSQPLWGAMCRLARLGEGPKKKAARRHACAPADRLCCPFLFMGRPLLGKADSLLGAYACACAALCAEVGVD